MPDSSEASDRSRRARRDGSKGAARRERVNRGEQRRHPELMERQDDGVRVGAHSLVAAGSLVREGFEIPEGMLVAGVPATVKRSLTNEERAAIARSANNYVQYVHLYHE